MDANGEARLNMPFVGIPSFLRAPILNNLSEIRADWAVLGVPTDEGSPYMPGSRLAPRSIREHSLRFSGGRLGFYDPQVRKQFLETQMRDGGLVDAGDVDVLPTNVEGTFANITDVVRRLVNQGVKPAVIGGDHAVTYPVVRAFSGPVHVVHFDAHLDYMPFVHGIELTNSHPFRHIAHLPQVESLTQVGIRSIRNTEEMHEDSLRDGNNVVTMQDIRRADLGILERIVPANSQVYVSIDIDALDLALVPGCVSAEPDGMQYGELREMLFGLAEHADIVGFDLVEVNPQLDVRTGITSYLGAHTMLEFLGRICG